MLQQYKGQLVIESWMEALLTDPRKNKHQSKAQARSADSSKHSSSLLNAEPRLLETLTQQQTEALCSSCVHEHSEHDGEQKREHFEELHIKPPEVNKGRKKHIE